MFSCKKGCAMRGKFLSAAMAAAVLGFAGSAGATITVYTSQTDFLAALSAQGEDTFNDLKRAEVGVSTTRSAGTFSYTASSTVSAPGVSFLVGSGSKTDSYLGTDLGQDSILFTDFSSGVNAIGGDFFVTNAKGAAASRPLGMFLYLVGGGGEEDYEYIPNATASSFLGFVSTDGITELQVEQHSFASATGDYTAVNNLYLGTAKMVAAPAPEPSAWALMLVGFGGLGATLRARRRGRSAAMS
jgi:hypothetical protein